MFLAAEGWVLGEDTADTSVAEVVVADVGIIEAEAKEERTW